MLAFTFQPVQLAPGQSVSLSFAFGFCDSANDVRAIVEELRATGAARLWRSSADRRERDVLRVHFNASMPFAAAIEREAVWRSHNVLSWATWRGDWNRTALTQGSAYLYLHGADGVPRDQSLFALTALFQRPDVVRSTIELLLETQAQVDGAMTYAWGDFALRSDALGLHAWPCDLDVFVLWAVSEYVGVTGDVAWLGRLLPRLRAAAAHLINAVGVGPHGLLRVGDGDWDDGVVVGLANPVSIALTIARGESIPTTAMACVVLPKFARLVQRLDAVLAAQLQTFVRPFAAALRSTAFYNGTFARLWAFDGFGRPLLVGNGTLELQSIVWPLLAPDNLLLTRGEKVALIDATLATLSSDIGPLLAETETNRQVWPAVSQLFVAGVASVAERAHLALPLLAQHLYATHARVFPTSWIGVLGGPDGFDAVTGGTWASVVTPMTDWPTANSNPDAMFLFGCLRIIGIQGTDTGFAVDASRLALEQLPVLVESPLLTVAINATSVEIVYVSQNSGSVLVTVTPFGASRSQTKRLTFAGAGETHRWVVS